MLVLTLAAVAVTAVFLMRQRQAAAAAAAPEHKAASTPGPSSTSMAALRSGDRVQIQGLVARPELNGEVGMLMYHVPAKSRWALFLNRTEERLLLRPENIDHLLVSEWDDPHEVLSILLDERHGWHMSAQVAPVSSSWEAAVRDWRATMVRYEASHLHRGRRPYHGSVSDAELACLGRSCPQLNCLILDYHLDNVTGAGLTAVARGCLQLQIMQLNTGKFDTKDILNLAPLCPQLTELDLSQCRSVTNIALVAVAQHCPLLQKLSLSGCGPLAVPPVHRGLGDVGIVPILEACTHITTLNLHGCPATDQTAFAIARQCPHLTELNIGGVRTAGREHITQDGLLAIARSCPNLKQLDCWHLRWVTNDLALVLAPLVPQLYQLQISGTQVSDAGVASFVENCTCLTDLDLSYIGGPPFVPGQGWGISDDAIRAIVDNCAHLTSLHLRGNNRLTEACIPLVRELSARGCHVAGIWPGQPGWDED